MTTTRPSAAASGALTPFEDLHDLLEQFSGERAVSADDVLAAVLPLMRQAADLHEQGQVAPLDGREALRVYRGRLFFGPGKGLKPRWNAIAVNRLQGMAGALDIDSAYRALPVAAAEIAALSTGEDAPEPILPRGRTPVAPAFLPDYTSWEHAIGNHDPLTDMFSLGMIAASLAVGLDFTEPAELETFVRARRRLTTLNARLHPLVARILAEMTELDRRARAQDLRAVVARLENHRGLGVVVDAPPPEAGAPGASRRMRVLAELRGRLYDLSRRNKLLHHKPASTELDLTEASTPIVLRVDAIRPEQLFTWGSPYARRLAKGETVALGEVVRFEDMDHAATALDRIRAQARKDRTEFGFSQLRLVLAFLRWRNLKDDPETPISSPLLLAPVELKKRRGVRDSYELKATSPEAEVNPTLRRCLKLLYGVELPTAVPLDDEAALERLVASLGQQIARGAPGVRVETQARPDVRSLHERALRRVDLHKRRSRPAAAAARRHGDLVYSYARTSWRPLGAQLYHAHVAPAELPRREEGKGKRALDLQFALPLDEMRAAAGPSASTPARASKAAPTKSAAPSGSTALVVYEEPKPPVKDSGDQNLWLVDLCSVTLANFNYRKMSLVRDFDAMIGDAGASVDASTRDALLGGSAFGPLFDDAPRPIAPPALPPALAEAWTVVPSDPTQDAAVGRAREGRSYVIQGPPGAGKSQTIANLIADYLGRGKRVLFVCEKRAALDVVYARLEALGLHRLCARVHDSQEDKKAFVVDLKHLFETWLDAAPDDAALDARAAALGGVGRALDRFAALDLDMCADADGEPLHGLVGRAAAGARPGSTGGSTRAAGLDADHLPSLADWRAGRAAALAMEEALRRLGSEPILARHPARFVSAEASADPDLFHRLAAALDALGPQLEAMEEAARLAVWPAGAAPLSALFAQIDLAARLLPLAERGTLDFLLPESNLASRVREEENWLRDARKSVIEAREKTTLWAEKLTPDECDAALLLARQHENSLMGFLSPAWRRAKAEVTRCTGLDRLKIKPTIRALLENLAEEHAAEARVRGHLREMADRVGLGDGESVLALGEERDARRAREGAGAQPLFDLVRRETTASKQRIFTLARLKKPADAARAALARCFEGLEALPVERAFAALSELRARRESLPAFAPALRALAAAPETVRSALRRLDAPLERIEEAVIDVAVERVMAVRPSLREASGAGLDATAAEADRSLSAFRRANAALLIDGARRRFTEHVHLTQRLDLELDHSAQAQRRAYVAARQDLERELGKSQRFRSVRELMSGPAGLLIRDLKPVWLMSPLSVADVLPLDPGAFDVAIFDEASQVPVEEAAPTLLRAPQVIVVGDEKQLPPTNFFGPGASEESVDGPDDSLDEDDVSADLDAASFLAQAAKTLPSTLLGWHYRSRSEELIAFSNAVFYAGKLVSVPSTRLTTAREPIVPAAPVDGARTWAQTLDRAVSFHLTPFGVYEKQRNAPEAAYVAEMVRKLLLERPAGGAPKSLGVVAFSEAQQSEIERALERLAREDAAFRDALEAEVERDDDGRAEGLFVKNLENVQGDERDIIIVSVCYAPDPNGRMRMNFGPINRAGGEKRLNVIFTRAREHLALVSSITGDAITNDYNTGALCLKTYLRYAEAVSRGDLEAMRRSLHAVAPHASARATRKPSPLAGPLAEALRARGLEAVAGLGESAFVADVAVRRPGAAAHELAVLIDGPEHYGARNLLERHVVKPTVLAAFGWRTLTVLGLDWRRDPDGVIERIERALAA